MTLGNRKYELTLASDLQADGLLLELDDVTGGGRATVAAVSYSDADGSMSFTAYRPELPLAAVEHLVAAARHRLPPTPAGPSA